MFLSKRKELCFVDVVCLLLQLSLSQPIGFHFLQAYLLVINYFIAFDGD